MPIPLYPMPSFSTVSHQASLDHLPRRLSTWVWAVLCLFFLLVEHSRWLTSYPFSYFVWIFVFLNLSGIPYMVSEQLTFLGGWNCQPHANSLLRRTGVSLLVWVITFDLSGKEGPTSSKATAGIRVALRIIWPLKSSHYFKVVTPSGGRGEIRQQIMVWPWPCTEIGRNRSWR
jgi:hypothetical protein